MSASALGGGSIETDLYSFFSTGKMIKQQKKTEPKRGKAQSGFEKNRCSPAFNQTGFFGCTLHTSTISLPDKVAHNLLLLLHSPGNLPTTAPASWRGAVVAYY